MNTPLRIYILLITLSTFACRTKEEKVMENNMALVRSYFATFNRHDWPALAEFYVESASFKDPAYGTDTVRQTRKNIAAKYAELQSHVSELKDSIMAMYPSGTNTVIVEFVSTGVLPDKRKLYLPICTVFTIENGKIATDYTYYDNAPEMEP